MNSVASDAVEEPLRSLLSEVASDANVVGVVLSGSRARAGMATEHSDIDVYVVVAAAGSRRTRRSAEIDVAVCTLDELRRVPGPGEDGWYERYAFTRCRVLLDRTNGELPRLLQAWGRLSGAESKRVLEAYLDGYVNFVYRSLKSLRDGRLLAARLDAAESVMWGLPVLFAFDRRLRPYNKYLEWELRRLPLSRPQWSVETVIDWAERSLTTAAPAQQRLIFRGVEQAAREVGLGGIIDGWGDDLELLRGAESEQHSQG